MGLRHTITAPRVRALITAGFAGCLCAGAGMVSGSGAHPVSNTTTHKARALGTPANETSPLLALAQRPAQHGNPANDEPPDYRMAHVALPGPVPIDAFNQAVSQAQSLAAATAQQAPDIAATTWNFSGPTNIGGRITDLAIDPTNGNTVYAATAGGGVWKSTDGGLTFAPAWPADNVQTTGAIAIAPNGTLFLGTGESNPGGGSITYGGTGIYRSSDGGASWQNVGLPTSYAFGRIAVSPVDSNTIFAAAAGNLFVPGGERGLYRSTDGGNTWSLVLPGANATTGAVDVVIDPQNPQIVWAAMWDHLRIPSFRNYGGLGSGVYKSIDGGTTWSPVTGITLNDPVHGMGRIGLAVAPSNDNDVYAIVITWDGPLGGFFATSNGGLTWTKTNDSTLTSSQTSYGWWFGRLTVDPGNPLRVFAGGVSQSVTTNGGTSFTNVTTGHADHHALLFDPTDSTHQHAYIGNDGGLDHSTNGGSSFTRATFQPWTQFYSVGISQTDDTRLVGGAQDNGANRSYTTTGSGSSSGWNSYVGGDGTETLIDPANQEDVFGCSQYGSCSHFSLGGDDVGVPIVDNSSTRNNWFSPIVLDPASPQTTFYFAGNQLNRCNAASICTTISPDLTGNPTVTDPFYPNYGTITTIGAGPLTSNLIIVGTDTGYIQYTHDGGTTWTRSTDPNLPNAWVTRLAIDPSNVNIDYATFSAFRTGDHTAYVMRSTDGGVTWSDISGDLPQAPVNDIKVVGSRLVVASDLGVYITGDLGAHWFKLGSNLPLAPVDEIQYQSANNEIVAATFGRGMWIAALPSTLPSVVPEAPLGAVLMVVGAAGLVAVAARRRQRQKALTAK